VLGLDCKDRIVGLHDALVLVRGHRELAAALADGKSLQGVDIVVRSADHGSTERAVRIRDIGEIAGLDRAPGRKRGG
jgi:hypothetical protein